jgi:glycosyltransferase involved in cell wall biosynthesis
MMGPEVRGIGRYVNKLLEHLAAIDKEHEYVVFTRQVAASLVPASMRTVICEVPWYSLREQRELPAIFDGARLDLMHVPHWNAPLKLKTPLVITIHDMILWEHPSLRATKLSPLVYAAKYLFYRHLVSTNARHARKIITVSNSAANAILRTLDVPAEKISVTPLGIDPLPIATDPTPYSLLPTPYLLSVSSGYPHKNLTTFFIAADDLMNDDQSLHAVVCGIDPAFLPRVQREAEGIMLGNMPRTHLLGVVPDEQLGALYRDAHAFIFPSLAEGFGLPPLEAALVGVPVIASDIDTARETLGDASLLVPPTDVQAYLAAYRRLMTDPALKTANIQAEKERASRYSWDKTARLTLEAYRDAFSTR